MIGRHTLHCKAVLCIVCGVASYPMPRRDGGSAARKGVLAPCVDADDSCTYVPSGFVPKCKLGGYSWLVSHLVCHLMNT